MAKKMNLSREIRRAFAEQGKEGGKIGGKKAALTMTPEQKRARALKANAASQEAKRRKKAAQQEGE